MCTYVCVRRDYMPSLFVDESLSAVRNVYLCVCSQGLHAVAVCGRVSVRGP